MKTISFLLNLFFLCTGVSHAQNVISEKNSKGAFPVVAAKAAAIYTDVNDDWLIQKTAELFSKDIAAVTGQKPKIIHDISSEKNIIIIGTAAGSSLIKQFEQAEKFKTIELKNAWEAYRVQMVSHPLKGIEQALVIAGSDKRGAAYGVFELSKRIGVSPWYWWADVPVKKKKELFVDQNISLTDHPRVKYRGIFINDEAPAFSGWTKEKFGGANHLVYEKIFELLLRLKGNYLWPAMWGNAFNNDDTLNPVLADKWGIVMGTSHHEPMLRAQQEWKRYGKGQWNYDSNKVALDSFWRKGIENMDHHESIVTIGMRGDGDMPMTQGTAIDLLEKIVADQRKIILDVTGKPASETPQDWALYKEVQDYYDKGMRVPDDVTLLLCDDNWGNIRKLPKLSDKPRSGGYGIYYHFDYVGGPRNYKWINTNNIARVWEQMHLAYGYGVDKIWIVNVGDLKPMEFPISFFLDYAWNPERIGPENLPAYFSNWAGEQFGTKYSQSIGDLLRKYSQYASRRKPELLDENTYSLNNYSEMERVTNEWNDLSEEAQQIYTSLPADYRDAFFELLLHPIKAFSIIHNLYLAVAENHLYATANLIDANSYADSAKEFYQKDSLLTIEYNHLNNGKWNHMMDQTHIGYTYWQQPPVNKMPDVKYISLKNSVDSGISRTESSASAKDLIPKKANGNIFYEQDGYVSIEASHYTKANNTSNIKWKVISRYWP